LIQLLKKPEYQLTETVSYLSFYMLHAAISLSYSVGTIIAAKARISQPMNTAFDRKNSYFRVRAVLVNVKPLKPL
jgi:hypothetical protein